ncbi:SDR family oxidoreductase [Phaeacidiphilus oryzae]|uniref:SDR family oxidoreductase n=1 Tax=Phaeacidiphilus oryzae TaxID=348818 RepID=UPI00055C4C24|nr:NAD(P)H-binding protein [Phaeacidiphilus oryzae]
MRITVLGATGTAGSRTAEALRERGAEVVEASRSRGVDLVGGEGLAEALRGADAVVDASNPVPAAGSASPEVVEAVSRATRNVLDACAAEGVGHLVLLSIIGIEQPVFDGFPYYLAKREQERLVASGPVRPSIVKTSQWFEFATNPAAVEQSGDEVVVQDWLVQPVAVDSVAAVLAETALGEPLGPVPLLLTGPQRIRLPELTARLLKARGDARPVRTVPPRLPELAEGVLLAPDSARVAGPDVDSWLASPSAQRA